MSALTRLKDRFKVVFDVGKTHAKLSVWEPGGRCVERRVHRNETMHITGYQALDAVGLEVWLAQSLSECAPRHDIGAIIPVAHGAAAALVQGDRLFAPPMDYEEEPAAEEQA